MKFFSAFIFFNFFVVLSSYAQLPYGSIAPNFTISDIDGVEHDDAVEDKDYDGKPHQGWWWKEEEIGVLLAQV